jgi:hypothetical protein
MNLNIKIGDLIEWQGELHIVVEIKRQLWEPNKVAILVCPRTNEKYKVPTNLLRR